MKQSYKTQMKGVVLCLAMYGACFVSANSSPLSGLSDRIKHVIVLMEENRSFDHFFGFASSQLKTNGLSGKESNLYDTTDPSKGEFVVDNNVGYINDCDPDHSTSGTTSKIFGAAAVAAGNYSVASMAGFIEWENNKGHASNNYCDVMSMFEPEDIPVLLSLAEEYAIFDRFFAAHPGQTWPNRMFTLSATSAGSTATATWYHDVVGQLFPQRTIFDQVGEAGLEWRNYYNDTPWELFMESVATAPDNVRSMTEFWADAQEGNLPSFAWLNPSSGINVETGVGSCDQHPTHDVAAGEQFIKDVYEAVRASPQWNETLLIITYDEHGGFYDHVPTPMNIPPPGDGEVSYPDIGFLFDRLGVRIPTVLVSPWIEKGTVISEPPEAQKPAANSEYDLTSIMATARILLGMDDTPALTDRDAWSATFEHVLFNLTEPRTDCPLHTPDAPAPTEMFQNDIPLNHASGYEAMLPVNDLQTNIVTMLNLLANNDHEFPHHLIKRQGHVGQWYTEAIKKWRLNQAALKKKKEEEGHDKAQQDAEKSSLQTPGLRVVCQPRDAYTSKDNEGWILGSESSDAYSVYTKTLKTDDGIAYCLSAPLDATATANSSNFLSIIPCAQASSSSSFITSNHHLLDGVHDNNGDVSISNKIHSKDSSVTMWKFHLDSTLRPSYDTTLCATCSGLSGSRNQAMILPCDNTFSQHFAYHGDAPGNSGGGMFEWGDDTNSLGVVDVLV